MIYPFPGWANGLAVRPVSDRMSLSCDGQSPRLTGGLPGISLFLLLCTSLAVLGWRDRFHL